MDMRQDLGLHSWTMKAVRSDTQRRVLESSGRSSLHCASFRERFVTHKTFMQCRRSDTSPEPGREFKIARNAEGHHISHSFKVLPTKEKGDIVSNIGSTYEVCKYH